MDNPTGRIKANPIAVQNYQPAGSVVCHLKDGREIDLSNLTAEEAVLKLQSAGVKTDDIEATVHHIGKGTIK
jgi:hypothetical protein